MAAQSSPFTAGEVLSGSWRLERVLGRGGMGSVFEATELQLGRKVAVKILHSERGRDEDFARFEREARMMAKLDHPNLVPLYAYGRHREVPFIVMRMLEGARLSTVLKENGGKLTWAQWRPLLGQLCDALQHVHDKRMVHRDVKPSNVFVSPQGWVTLLDMGLTRGWKTPLTRTGMVWGTPEFISPEQAMAERELDGRADLYSLAALTYLVLSGELPFSAKSTQAYLSAHLTKERPDVSRTEPTLPRPFGKVVMRAMAIDADQRHPSVHEFLASADHAFEEKTEPLVRAVREARPPRTGEHSATTDEVTVGRKSRR